MKVRVEIGSLLRARIQGYDSARGMELAIVPGMTAAALIEQLGLPPEDVQIITVNRRTVGSDHALRENDKVGLFSALVGG